MQSEDFLFNINFNNILSQEQLGGCLAILSTISCIFVIIIGIFLTLVVSKIFQKQF